jgi:hypothetical protein
MTYQSKTTVITIGCMWWTQEPPVVHGSAQLAEVAVANQIAMCCNMDIMSIAHFQENDANFASTTVVYVNNGVSYEDIIRIMKPEMNNNPSTYWMILGINKWQGILECVVSVRGIKETWQ